MKKRLPIPVSLALALGLGLLLLLSAAGVQAGKAEKISHLGTEYVVYWVDLATDELQLCWQDDQGKPLGTFSRLKEHLAKRSQELKFAINGGIYSDDQTPLGLHIQDSKTLHKLNLGDTEGGQFNFYLKPNGVFYLAADQAGVVESDKYARMQIRPIVACQSGPLLLTNGVIHHAFRAGSKNLHWRTGVGVTKDNRIVFALSLQALCFHDFARLFKEKLGCDNALYLDGDICAIYLPELGHEKDGRSAFAAMFAVTPKTKPTQRTPEGE